MKRDTAACPHCGRSGKKAAAKPAYLAVSALMLAVSVYFWYLPPRGRAAGAPAAGRDPYGGLSAEAQAYILSPEAAPACGACMASAGDFMKRRRREALAARTGGMALVPAGEYPIGSPEGVGDPDEHPLHLVRLAAFYLDTKETTIAEYMQFAGSARAHYPEWSAPGGKFNVETGTYTYYRRLSGLITSCPDCPVFGVTAGDAAAYCAARGKRLPTEAEWEAAARAGSSEAFSFGAASGIGDYAWYAGNSAGVPHAVGTRRPNAFGLYDMHGNVWEWTSDLYDKKYYAESPAVAPAGPPAGREHVLRGGSWDFDADSLRSGNRASSFKANDDIGFRCAAGLAELEGLAERDVSGPGEGT